MIKNYILSFYILTTQSKENILNIPNYFNKISFINPIKTKTEHKSSVFFKKHSLFSFKIVKECCNSLKSWLTLPLYFYLKSNTSFADASKIGNIMKTCH